MRFACFILVPFVLSFCVILALLPGCEDVLEGCQPCGDVLEGRVTISGDPRIDGTFASVQQIRHRLEELIVSYESGRDELLEVFGKNTENAFQLADLKSEVDRLYGPGSAAPLTIHRRPSRCFVDKRLALEAQYNCEKELCNTQTMYEEGLCRGYVEGPCIGEGEGQCFTDSNGPCDGMCLGVCREFSSGLCPGLCLGKCDEGKCDARDDNLACLGHCFGTCNGICESDVPFDCPSDCIGLCGLSTESSICADTDIFKGHCQVAASDGSCRGHFFPTGCDDQCVDCANVSADCREMANVRAWSGMTCHPASYDILVNFSADPENRSELVLKMQTLERVLTRIATDNAWLSLMVNGLDIANDMDVSVLTTDNALSHLDDGVNRYLKVSDKTLDIQRVSLPLENLKARLFWIRDAFRNAESGFQVAAGAYDCIEPAIDTTLEVVQNWVPVVDNNGADREARPYFADFKCSKTSSDDDLRCLYALLDKQIELLNIVVFTD